MADHIANADGTILWRYFVAKEQYLGGIRIHFDYLVASLSKDFTQEDTAVDQVSDDGTLVGVETANPHLGQLEFKQAALPVGERKMALAGLVQATETRWQIQWSADGDEVWTDIVHQFNEFSVFVETA